MVLIPHLKFIEALVATKLPIHSIKEKLQDLDLRVDDQVLAVIINTIRSNYPTYFSETDPDPVTALWLEELDVLEMYAHLEGNSDFKQNILKMDGAVKLLQDPLMYRIITSIAMAHIEPEDIELIVQAKFNLEYSEDDINLFLKYFFSVSEWSRKQKQGYIVKIRDKQLSAYYKIALKGDKEFLLWKLGISPAKDFKEMLVEMTNDSFYNFKETSTIKPDSAQKWAQLSTRLMDKLDDMDKREKGEAKGLLSDIEFRIKTYATPNDIRSDFKHFTDLDIGSNDEL